MTVQTDLICKYKLLPLLQNFKIGKVAFTVVTKITIQPKTFRISTFKIPWESSTTLFCKLVNILATKRTLYRFHLLMKFTL